MNDGEDRELVVQCLHGHQQAFEALVDKYKKPVFNVAMRMLNDYHKAEDVTQDVFIKAYNNLSKFNQKFKFFSWLYRIAINESINYQNAQKHTEPLDDRIASYDHTPEDIVNAEERQELISSAIYRLAVDYRTVVILKHIQGFSYTEIGEILEIPEKTVKSRLFTARQQLKDILLKQL
jgi:RNA polymerase sigma-70 factor (ECF subfamily)